MARGLFLDSDLARIYSVPTKALNQAVKRNQDRFPEDFVFQLSAAEKLEVVTNCDHLARLRFSPVLPYAFTENGAIMAANALNSGPAGANVTKSLSTTDEHRWTRMKSPAKELKRRKDFSLSASIASPLSIFSHQSSTLVTRVRCRILPP